MKIQFTLDLTGTAYSGFGHLEVTPSKCPSKLNDNPEIDSYLKSLRFEKGLLWGWDLEFNRRQLAGGSILSPAMDVANQVADWLISKGGIYEQNKPSYYGCDRGYNLEYGKMVYCYRAGSTPNYGYGSRGPAYLCTEYRWRCDVVLPWWRQ